MCENAVGIFFFIWLVLAFIILPAFAVWWSNPK